MAFSRGRGVMRVAVAVAVAALALAGLADPTDSAASTRARAAGGATATHRHDTAGTKPLLSVTTYDIAAFTPTFSLENVDKATGARHLIGNLSGVGGLFGGCFAHVAKSHAVLTVGLDADVSSTDLSLIATNGTKLADLHFKGQLSTNAEYDDATGTTWVVARDMTTLVNNVWALDLTSSGQIDMRKTVTLPPKMIVEIGQSTFCPVSGVLFLTTRADGTASGIDIIRVSVRGEQKVLSNVPLADSIEVLMWDSAKQVMYAWFATETAAGVLGTIDPVTGKTLSTILEFKDLSSNPNLGASAVLDAPAGMVYASLLNMTDPAHVDGVPTFVVVDLATNTSTVVTTGGPFYLNIAL